MNKQDLAVVLDTAFSTMVSWRKQQCYKHGLAPDADEYAANEINNLSNTEFFLELIQALEDLN